MYIQLRCGWFATLRLQLLCRQCTNPCAFAINWFSLLEGTVASLICTTCNIKWHHRNTTLFCVGELVYRAPPDRTLDDYMAGAISYIKPQKPHTHTYYIYSHMTKIIRLNTIIYDAMRVFEPTIRNIIYPSLRSPQSSCCAECNSWPSIGRRPFHGNVNVFVILYNAIKWIS